LNSSSIFVRPLASPTEYELHFHFADQEFASDPSPASAQFWQQAVMSRPGYHPEQVRGAFRDGEQLGSYIIEERVMRMGKAQLATGCIAVVVTYPTHRNQGVASAMMEDAIQYANANHQALLLLDGIPKFYHRFGYIDMFDQAIHEIDRTAILAQPQSKHTIQAATLEDASSVLALYDRHYGPYTGSFKRTVEQQAHRLAHRSAENPLWVAVHGDDLPEGYLALGRGDERSQAFELAADNWSATLALLQHHAKLLEGPTAPLTLRYRLPLTAPALQWMIDHLEVPDTSHWKHPADEWVVRSQSFHHRDAGWMARLVDLATFAQAMLPEWQERWLQSLSQWSSKVELIVDDASCIVQIDNTQLRLVHQVIGRTKTIHLTPELFIQVAFGYRPIAWALHQSGQSIDDELHAVLEVLFPTGHTWIPASDWF
jgi:predicted N-acetyltransferase YhbS